MGYSRISYILRIQIRAKGSAPILAQMFSLNNFNIELNIEMFTFNVTYLKNY